MWQPQRIAMFAIATLALSTLSGEAPRWSPPAPETLPSRAAVERPGLRLEPGTGLHADAPALHVRSAESDPQAAWRSLQREADAGDPRAACELALLLDDCRIASAIGEMVETQVSMAAWSDANPVIAAAEIAALEASAEAYRPQCASVPDALRERGWRYLLAAAIAGHEASIHRFLTDPPFYPDAGEQYRQARQRYREDAPLLLGDLLQRQSPGAIALAFRAAQGEALFEDLALQPRDPAAVVRLGTALVTLHEDAAREAAIEAAIGQLSPRVAARARGEGRKLALRLLPDIVTVNEPAAATAGECAEGWPGSRSHATAYTY